MIVGVLWVMVAVGMMFKIFSSSFCWPDFTAAELRASGERNLCARGSV